MAAADNILKKFNLFVDGIPFPGQVTELTPPVLALQTEEFRAGGMDAPVQLDMGQQVMEASFVLTGYDESVLRTWGIFRANQVPLRFLAAKQDLDGTTEQVDIQMTGKVLSVDRGAWAPGAVTTVTITYNPVFYQELNEGEVIVEIDVLNSTRIVDGVDQLAAQRAALQL